MKIKKVFLLFLIPFLFTSCFEDMDDKMTTASTLEIQNFIYRGLNYFYLYKEDVPKLANDAFVSEEEKNDFLKTFASPEALFSNLLSSQDRFSRLFDDYIAIENALAGVSLSNGMEFGLVRYPDQSENVFGYVRYILPETDADLKNLKRGDLFTTVDGVQLTENNYQSLLSSENYTIGLATFENGNFVSTGESVDLSKIQYDENPILIHKTLDIQGKKIGYLFYTGFTKRYDSELNQAFAEFKADGISDLIVDLRYNGGGSVETAVALAGMITGQFTGEVFYKQIWNEDRQQEFGSDGLFTNKLSSGSSLNSLNLSTVYFITTKNTASASELVINGLNPYIDITQVGDATTGKFQASFLMYDSPNFGKQGVSLSHTYAMLPLVFKTANKNGYTDFNSGLEPDVFFQEDFFHLGNLGDPEEPLLAAALSEIITRPKPVSSEFTFQEVSDSKMNSPINGKMIVESDSK